MHQEPLVSICCITYNQEEYIADTIEGFLLQETKYPVEILIGDDCSQDRTAQIARDYQEKHPELIQVLVNEKNIKGRRNLINLIRQARGKYIAMCEGDDYWTDPGKLDRQVGFLEEHPACAMCFHGANVVDGRRRRLPLRVRPYREDRWCSPADIIPLAGGGIATASKVSRKSCFDEIPDWYWQAHAGDMAQDLLFARYGDAYYLDRIMSSYRLGVRNSWTRKRYSGPDVLDKKRTVLEKDLTLYRLFDEETGGRHQEAVDRVCTHIQRILLLLSPGRWGEKRRALGAMRKERGLKRTVLTTLKYTVIVIYAKTLARFVH